jgi:hypothetical protein
VLEFDLSSKIITTESLLAIYKVREIIHEIKNTQLAKSLFKLNLASLYSPNLILRDLLENILLSCSAHLFLSVLSLLVCNNLEVNNTINWLYKALFMNWIFKRYFVSLSIIEFMNHSEFMTGIVKLHNIEYTLKSH